MESISRISSMLETARDLTIEAAQSASAARGLRSNMAPRPLPLSQLKKLLDSRNDREILEGLRRVIGMMYRRSPSCVALFSSVIKNVASASLEIRKLVYIYLLHYAEAEPDLALLSINAIQKALTDPNAQLRALALKVMSGIRVPVISQIVGLAIKKGRGDMSAVVRRAAALAIPKCYRLDPATAPQLLECLAVLLGDRQYYVAGAAVMAFLEVCPERMEMVHKHYRGLVRKLVDMDEWAQLATLRLMAAYARRCFPRRTRWVNKVRARGFYEDDDDGPGEEKEEVQLLDPDLELLLDACRPLLQSRNSAVIVAVARCYLHLATPDHIDTAVGPLVSLLRGPADIQQMALYNIVSICLVRPQPFVKYATRFLLHNRDPPLVWWLKLEVLTIIFPFCGTHLKGVILNELEHFSKGTQEDLVRESVRAIGRCAQSDPSTSARCLRLLLKQISSTDGNLVAESVTVIRHLIQRDPGAHEATIIHLAKNLDTATNPEARASIIWLVGEFASEEENSIAPDMLRILVKGFADESAAAKLQIVLLAAKVYVHHLNRTQQPEKEAASERSAYMESMPAGISEGGFATLAPDVQEPEHNQSTTMGQEHPIVLLWKYVLLLARYDTSYDLRDRARFYRALLADPSSTQLATLLLLAPKPVPHTPSPGESRKDFVLGSASLAIGDGWGLHGLRGYEPLPPWVEEGKEPDPALREEGPVKGDFGGKSQIPAGDRLDSALGDRSAPGAGRNKLNGPSASGKEKTLDDWLAEGQDHEEATEESAEEEDDDDDDDETSEEESESGEEQEHRQLVS
ncbi:MAG: AP-3 complex subunit beta [Peltula sp. TS41687]|nr:MAG: AP-3 complex subunit beta [Peltula sp. TS41687]